MIGEDGRVYRDRPYPRPTPEFNEAINKLRRDLERGPKSTMTPDEEAERTLSQKIKDRLAGLADGSIPDPYPPERNAAVHGSDIRRTEPDTSGGGQPGE